MRAANSRSAHLKGAPTQKTESEAKMTLALYRNHAGISTWTGIARDGDTLKKLDDPSGDLDGPGHVMEPNEFISEMQQYDGSTPIAKPIVTWEGVELVADDSERSDFDAEPPFIVSKVVQIRSDDRVKVAVRDEKRDSNGVMCLTRERVWMHVVSVTIFGVVTAVPLSQLKWSPIGPHAPVYFHADAVIGRKSGKNW